jgi:prepilin-type N-terminal cleavage/methylation domain-containing protein
MKNHCFIGLFENNFVMKVTRANQLYAVRGFTLIELMLVILVIGIVGGIIFSGAGYLFEKQSIKTAQAEIEILKIALNEYHRKEGEYPPIEGKSTDFKDFSGDLLNGLYGSHEFKDGSWERLDEEDKKKSLIPIDKFSIQPIDEEASGTFNLDEVDHFLVDPWGQPYIYEDKRKDGFPGFLLYSMGPDRKSAPFTEPSDGLPERRPEDLDNIPSTEPGNW